MSGSIDCGVCSRGKLARREVRRHGPMVVKLGRIVCVVGCVAIGVALFDFLLVVDAPKRWTALLPLAASGAVATLFGAFAVDRRSVFWCDECGAIVERAELLRTSASKVAPRSPSP